MRVVGGSARGIRLAPLPGRTIRPTPDRVREALFSILYSRRGPLAGARVLDLFAGSGALGIEALSRGAEHAWFVDSSRQAIGIVRQNLERCRLTARGTTILSEFPGAVSDITAAGPFDIVLADPPYMLDFANKILSACAEGRLLAEEGILCIETAAEDPVLDHSGAIRRIDQRRYGTTMLHFFQPSSEEPA